MKHIALVLAALTGFAMNAPASAQPTSPASSPILTSIDDEMLRIALYNAGAKAAPLDDDANTLRIAFPNGIRAIARRMACIEAQGAEEEECKGLILLGYFSKPDDVSEAQQQAALTRFGLEQNLASVVVNREGEHVVKSYIIFDGGITIDNLIVRIALFGESVKAYQELLYAD
ncbi:MAG: hypothetical protein AAFR64_00285 [Pseudomonadota bacterium]